MSYQSSVIYFPLPAEQTLHCMYNEYCKETSFHNTWLSNNRTHLDLVVTFHSSVRAIGIRERSLKCSGIAFINLPTYFQTIRLLTLTSIDLNRWILR